MWCIPCQKKAEARQKAMRKMLEQQNPQAAKTYAKATTRVLPRYEGPKWRPITNTEVKPHAIWNETYQTFIMNKNK